MLKINLTAVHLNMSSKFSFLQYVTALSNAESAQCFTGDITEDKALNNADRYR